MLGRLYKLSFKVNSLRESRLNVPILPPFKGNITVRTQLQQASFKSTATITGRGTVKSTDDKKHN